MLDHGLVYVGALAVTAAYLAYGAALSWRKYRYEKRLAAALREQVGAGPVKRSRKGSRASRRV